MKRGEIHWGELPEWGRRPVLIVSRTAGLDFRTSVTVAPVTRRIRGIPSELPLSRREGLPGRSVASCDNLATVRRDQLEPEPSGRLADRRLPELDRALVHALGIRPRPA